jgi:hypothetical protein
MSGPQDGVSVLAEHLARCHSVDAAIVVDGTADDLVDRLLADGWAYEGVEYVAGKRVRYLVPPDSVLPGNPDDEGER